MEMEPIFTRYLYSKNDVCNSLIWSMLDKEENESLFWAYELYFSGFEIEVFEILSNMYVKYYEEINMNIGSYLNSLVTEWGDNQEKHSILGTIVKMLCQCKISLTSVLTPTSTVEKNIILENILYPSQLSDEDIKEFNNFSLTIPSWKILGIVSKYRVRNSICEGFGIHRPVGISEIPQNWLYYASFTPIWRDRIHHFDGEINHEIKKIVFHDENKEEEFNDKFDYEPDEQSKEVIHRLYNSNYTEVSSKMFYNIYGKDSVFKLVRMKKRCKVRG